MELREFAERILLSESLSEKLAAMADPVTDVARGDAWRAELPARSENLRFCGRKEAPAMPRGEALVDSRKRAVAHHIMANHELQALEVMAFVVCAFPDAPAEFRRGLVKIMADEQRHTRLHIERMVELGMNFGDLPVNGYFWKKAQEFQSVLDYLAGLPLTFEGRNLDHTLEFEDEFAAAGDERSAAIMRAIHRDEIRHVAFGVHWLRELKPPEQSDFDAYQAHLHWPLRPEKSRGDRFDVASRRAAGMSEEFIARLNGTNSGDV